MQQDMLAPEFNHQSSNHMKKQLFSAAAMALGFVGLTSAQQSFSFETSEGFTTGSFPGQNTGWTIADAASESAPNGHLYISAEEASNGNQSLKFLAADTEPDALIGVSKDINPDSNVFTISQDVYTSSIDTDNGSDFILFAHDLQGSQNTLEVPASILYFDYEGGIYVVTAYNVAQEIFEAEEVGSFEAGNWYNIKATYDLTAATVTYFVNNTQIYTGPLMNGGTEINRINYSFDDFTTSYYLDNISVTAPTAGNPQHEAITFTAYPNQIGRAHV